MTLLRLLKVPELYGAVYVFAWGNIAYSDIEFPEDGTVTPARTPEERGWSLKNRQDALRTLARWTEESCMGQGHISRQKSTEGMLTLAKFMRCDGMAICYNLGCKGACMGLMETRRFFQQASFPSFIWEGNFADPRGCNEAEMISRQEAFLESLGLTRLET